MLKPKFGKFIRESKIWLKDFFKQSIYALQANCCSECDWMLSMTKCTHSGALFYAELFIKTPARILKNIWTKPYISGGWIASTRNKRGCGTIVCGGESNICLRGKVSRICQDKERVQKERDYFLFLLYLLCNISRTPIYYSLTLITIAISSELSLISSSRIFNVAFYSFLIAINHSSNIIINILKKSK